MALPEITVTITPEGKVEIHVQGVPGESCLDLTAPLEARLGGEILSRERTAEADRLPEATEQKLQQRRG